ncbi:MAG: DUF3467 domain-containing protein [Candidatus Aenigmatarchaeota archaeon]
MEAKKKKVNVNIDPGKESFYSNNAAVFNNANEFIFDFTQITPRMDMIQEKQVITYMVKHVPVVLEPKQAKIFLNLLKENLEKYEKKFGKIDVAKAKSEKKAPLSKKFSDYIG